MFEVTNFLRPSTSVATVSVVPTSMNGQWGCFSVRGYPISLSWTPYLLESGVFMVPDFLELDTGVAVVSMVPNFLESST